VRVWIDLANSPHVPFFEPIADRLTSDGHELLVTARDHAQTVALARESWPDAVVVGGESPSGRSRKGAAVAHRADRLRRLARAARPDVALSHGSYAQLLAAVAARVPGVTMMDYEYQPANHLSFRLARRVIVPAVFPEAALRRYGARPHKVIRYPGFKEEVYLARFAPSGAVLGELGLDGHRVIAVFRAPPDGALYHRDANNRFDDLLEDARSRSDVQAVLLPRTREQEERYRALDGVIVPEHAVDGRSLLASADLLIGGGGTMNRESALLGTPTYTVFNGRLAAVDAELIRTGRLRDLRSLETVPAFEKKPAAASGSLDDHARAIHRAVAAALAAVAP
jgi:predicted glycosyltransferase